MTVNVRNNHRLEIKVKPKKDLADLIWGSEDIPRDELHIKEGSEIAEAVKAFPKEVSFTLRAISEWGPGNNFTVGYIKEPKIVYRKDIKKPLAINSLIMERAEDRFSGGLFYKYYNLAIFSPRMDRTPQQDWGVIKFYTDSPRLGYLARFNDLLGSSDDIPEDELHVMANSEHAKILRKAEKLEYITSPCYVRLRSFICTRYEDVYSGQTRLDFGIYRNMKVVYVDEQKTPLLLRRSKSEKNPFRFFHSTDVVQYVEIDSAANLERRINLEKRKEERGY